MIVNEKPLNLEKTTSIVLSVLFLIYDFNDMIIEYTKMVIKSKTCLNSYFFSISLFFLDSKECSTKHDNILNNNKQYFINVADLCFQD